MAVFFQSNSTLKQQSWMEWEERSYSGV